MKNHNTVLTKIRLKTFFECLELVEHKIIFQKEERVRDVREKSIKNSERAFIAGRLKEDCDILNMLFYLKTSVKTKLEKLN